MRLFALFFLLGNVYVQINTELASLSVIAIFLCLSVTMTLLVAYNFKFSEKKFQLFTIALTAFVGGLFASTLAASVQLNHRIQPAYEGKDLLITGRVVEIPDVRPDGTRFRFKVKNAWLLNNNNKGESTPINLSGVVRLGWFKNAQSLNADEQWQLRVRLKQPSGFVNPAGFDYEKWLFSQRLGATGYVRASKDAYLAQIKRLAESPWWSVNRLRQKIHSRIQNKVEDKQAAGVLSALLVAVRSRLNDRQWQQLQETGTSHLIAISGLHIAVVAGFAYLPVMLIWVLFPGLNERVPLRLAGAITGVVFATAYALLAGFTLPTQRALLMVVIALFGLVSRKHYHASSILAAALLAVLLLDPLAPMSASFWLSFLAVSLILIFIKRQMEQPRFQLISLQLVLSLAMLPLTLLFFNSASLIAPLANLIAIPWVSMIIVPVSLLAVLFMPVSAAISGGLLSIAALAINGLFKFLDYLSGWSTGLLSLPQIPWLLLLMAFVGILFLLLPKGFPGRWLGLLAIVPALLFSPPRPDQNAFKYTLLDVGQGLASVLQTSHHTLVYDTGTRLSDSFDIGKLVLVPYLKSIGLGQIDTLLVSHEDNDHRGGAPALLKAIQVKQIISSEPHIVDGYRITACYKGMKWRWDGVDFEVLSPLLKNKQDSNEKDNNRSCVLRISNSQHSLLLTADIEGKIEKELIKTAKKAIRVDVLSVPHHGSKTSSSDDFIRATSAPLGIISAGYRNRFHHPAEKIVKRYQKHGVKLLNTSDYGALDILFPASAEPISIKAYRLDNSGFWRRR